MALRWLVGELKTGRITGSLPMTEQSWSMVMDDAGTLSGTLTLADADVRALNPRAAAEPGRCFLAAVWSDPDGDQDDVILEAGPVWSHDYDADSRKLRIGGAGVWSYYDRRKVLGVLADFGGAAKVTYETGPTSLGTIGKNLIELAHTHTNGELPIVLPDDVDGEETRTYAGSELAWVGQKLRDLTQEDGGPEIQFMPRFASDERYVEWVMRVGTPDEPMLTQTGGDWVWDQSVPKSSVASLSVSIDGTSLASRAWAAGAASGEDRLIEFRNDSTLTDFGWPLLEIEAEGTDSVTSALQLASRARQAVTAARLPVHTWTLKVRADAYPHPGMVRPGDWGRVVVGDGHDYLTRGEFRGRVTQIAGDDSDAISIQFQPTPGVV